MMLSHLSLTERLADLLSTDMDKGNALLSAQALLQKFTNLHGILQCSLADFCQISGLDSQKYHLLQTMRSLIHDYVYEDFHQQKTVIADHPTTINFLKCQLSHLQIEIFAGLFLDNHNQLLAYEELSRGTYNQARVYPREVVKRALHHNAAAVIFAHNHPSGVCDASNEDLQITKLLKETLALVDVTIHDHIIIGHGEFHSFLQEGWL